MTRASDLAKLLGAGATILDGTTISTADNTEQLTLTSTDADANVGPSLNLYRNSGSPADSDLAGIVNFTSRNDNSQDFTVASLDASVIDVSDGTEDGRFRIKTMTNGALKTVSFVGGNMTVSDSQEVRFGNAADLKIYHDGTNSHIDNDTGDFTLDVAGNILLDADDGNIHFKDGGTGFVSIINSSSDAVIQGGVQDKDIIFKGNDGGGIITALTLDMSDAGTAIFNHDISLADNGRANFGSSADFQIYHDSSNAYLRNELSDSDIIFQVNDGGSQVEVGRFDASSRGMAVGTYNSSGLHTMVVGGATGGNATFKAGNTSTSGNTTCILAFMDGSGSATSSSAFLQGYNGANNFYLLGNGTHTFTSDENAKKNIETTRDGYLEDLARLRVVKYNWKHEEDGANKELGLIAQEVEEVFPNLVMEDFDPQIEDGQRRNKMIKTTVLPFMFLKALQEANTKMTALEARITELEGA